jgi:purine-binding chemotaxis protein CheW
MSERIQLLVFLLDGQRCGIPVAAVERIIQAVMTTPLPRASEVVSGVIDVHGRVIPVVNMRRALCLPERDLDPDDAFIIAQASRHTVALHVDGVGGVAQCAVSDIFTVRDIYPHLEYMRGVAIMEFGMVVIHDLEAFFRLDEQTVESHEDRA